MDKNHQLNDIMELGKVSDKFQQNLLLDTKKVIILQMESSLHFIHMDLFIFIRNLFQLCFH